MKIRFIILCLSLLAPALVQAAANDTELKKSYIHRLQLADRLRIAVYQEDDLTTQTRIDAHGKINLPLLGEVAIGGLTVAEAQVDWTRPASAVDRIIRSVTPAPHSAGTTRWMRPARRS